MGRQFFGDNAFHHFDVARCFAAFPHERSPRRRPPSAIEHLLASSRDCNTIRITTPNSLSPSQMRYLRNCKRKRCDYLGHRQDDLEDRAVPTCGSTLFALPHRKFPATTRGKRPTENGGLSASLTTISEEDALLLPRPRKLQQRASLTLSSPTAT